MSKIIDFYFNRRYANKKPDYYIKNILKWNDYKLEKNHDWVQWVFPLPEKSKYNLNAPILDYFDIHLFKSTKILDKTIYTAFIRLLNFYGFTLDPITLLPKQYKSLYRKENGIIVGLYSSHNYLRITRIMRFFNLIGKEYLSLLFFLAMCQAINSDPKLNKKVVDSSSLKYWMNTQDFLKNYKEDETKKVLVLCQRKEQGSGVNTQATSVKVQVNKIKEYCSELLKTNDLNFDFLTPGTIKDKGIMDYNIIFSDNKDTEIFVKKHIGYYDVIVLHTCPFIPISTENNIKRFYTLLKNKGILTLNAFGVSKKTTTKDMLKKNKIEDKYLDGGFVYVEEDNGNSYFQKE